jgi:acylphosphatase
MRRVRLEIRGMVQGVSYRANTERAARRIGVTGWVRNQPDGGVLAEAQGAAERIDDLIAWCKQGPPAAVVESVKVLELPTVADERAFEIRW